MFLPLVYGYYIRSNLLGETLKSYSLVNSFSTTLNNWTLELTKKTVLGIEVLKGKIRHDNDSHVLIVKHSDHYSGIIQIQQKQYRLDPTDVLDGRNRQMILYRANDLKSPKTTCTSRNGIHQLQANTMSRLVKRAISTKSCSMVLLADATFFNTFEKDSKSKMIEAVEIASQIYESNFNVKLVTKNIQILNDKDLAINTAKSISEVLSALSTEQSGDAYGPNAKAENYCLSHLFTSKNFGATTGLAYEAKKDANVIGGICDGTTSGGGRSLNVGVSTSNLGSGNMNMNAWHTTVIHEISHGFGSAHDDDSKCRNVHGKIMQAIVNAEAPSIPGFSQCSLKDIKSKIAMVKCLTDDSTGSEIKALTSSANTNAASKTTKILNILSTKSSDLPNAEETTYFSPNAKPSPDPGLAPSQPPSADKKSTTPPPIPNAAPPDIPNAAPPAIPNAPPPQTYPPMSPPVQQQQPVARSQGFQVPGILPGLGGLMPRIQIGPSNAQAPPTQDAILQSSQQAVPLDSNTVDTRGQPQKTTENVQPVQQAPLDSARNIPTIQPASLQVQIPQIAHQPTAQPITDPNALRQVVPQT